MALDILLVDDDRDFADLLAESLRSEGHRVCVSRDAASALARARELEPHVVLLDIGLPDINGNELAQSLRRSLPSATPIIVITGRPQAQFLDDVDLILNKPIQAELVGGLIEYVRRRRQTTRLVGAPR